MRVEPTPNSKYAPIRELRLITRNYGGHNIDRMVERLS